MEQTISCKQIKCFFFLRAREILRRNIQAFITLFLTFRYCFFFFFQLLLLAGEMHTAVSEQWFAGFAGRLATGPSRTSSTNLHGNWCDFTNINGLLLHFGWPWSSMVQKSRANLVCVIKLLLSAKRQSNHPRSVPKYIKYFLYST